MWVARVDEGWLFGDLSPRTAEILKGIPMLLESEDQRVRARLLPETLDDAAHEADWRAHAVPELERLFASRATLVGRDLAAMRKMQSGEKLLLLVTNQHASAWLAALNAARLALYALNDLTAQHMDMDSAEPATPQQLQAVASIHLMAEMQSVLMGEETLESCGPMADLDL
ncbi:MAG: DUF2017 family protein [Phycisphaerales bacterium]|jgi:hypothetical protein|nr:DUF2017 family protein [Phycisphaerales bacterium]